MPFAPDQKRSSANLVSGMNAPELDNARLSRLLHDEVGQVLSAIGLQLDLLRMDIAEASASAGSRITEIQRLLEGAIGNVRNLSRALNPFAAGQAGLETSLQQLAERYRCGAAGVITMNYDSSVRPPAGVAAAMYKISELALDNAVRHSGAGEIEVLVKRIKTGVSLTVRDNGKGFSPRDENTLSRGAGMHLMRRHASAAGLRLSLASAPGRGTIVRVIHPVPTPRGAVRVRS